MNKFERISRDGRWTARTRETFVQADWEQGFAVSRVVLTGVRSMSPWVWDIFAAATHSLGTGGLIEPYDVLWLGRVLIDGGLADPSLLVAFVAEAPPDVHLTPTPCLRPVWVAERFLGQGWEARLVDALQTHHGVDSVRWDRRTARDAWTAAQRVSTTRQETT